MEPDIDTFVKSQFDCPGFAVGNDIVFLPAFKAMFNEAFRNKVYTPAEINYCEQFHDPLLRYASTWAAKEAVYKSIKQLDRAAMAFKAIEILRNKPAGIPEVRLLKHPDKFKISLSISHDGEYAWAIAFTKAMD